MAEGLSRCSFLGLHPQKNGSVPKRDRSFRRISTNTIFPRSVFRLTTAREIMVPSQGVPIILSLPSECFYFERTNMHSKYPLLRPPFVAVRSPFTFESAILSVVTALICDTTERKDVLYWRPGCPRPSFSHGTLYEYYPLALSPLSSSPSLDPA